MSLPEKFLAALFALASQAVFAGEVTRDAYPDADAVLLDCVEHTEYSPDGTYSKQCEQWVKVLTEKGRREESAYTLGYNARYARIRFIHVGIIGTNGQERAVDVSATTKEATDNSSMGSNIFDPMDRNIICTIPGLQVGETVHVKYERVSFKPRAEGIWADFSVLEWSCPYIRSSVSVKSPKELPLARMAVRNPLGNVTCESRTLEDGSVLRTWVATNSPQAFPEPDMPTFYTQMQNVQVSTASSWNEISRWYWGLCAPHLARADAQVTNKVREVTAGLAADDFSGRMRAIYDWVAQNIRYMGLTMEDTSPGYAPHDVDITFGNRYGVCRDKAGLLVAMLRIAGIEAYPVLIHKGPKKDPEVPTPFFNHAIVAAANPAAGDDSGRYMLMDPTDESSRDLMPAYLGNCSYLVARPEGEGLRTSPVPPADANALIVEADGELSPDGTLLLSQKFAFNGINDNAFRQTLLRKRAEDRRRFFESLLRNRFPGAELLRCEILPADLHDTVTPLSATVETRIPEALLRGETRDELNAPLVTPTLSFVNWMLAGKTSLEKRRFPLVVDSTASAVETLRIKLRGSAGEAIFLPDDRDFGGKYAYSRTMRVEDGCLTIRRRAAIDATEFTPAEYAELRERAKEIEAAERERPTFGKDRCANANVRHLIRRYEADLFGDSAWAVTNTSVKEILTYDGKKRSAELHFSFNPAWENVEIVSASVSNRDGKVSHVSESEINIMDCSWAAKAPRYPASRQMVVSLPSVETGSVISCVCAFTATNAPAPFYGRWYFDGYDPIDESTVRIGGFSRTGRNLKLLKPEPMSPPGELWRDCMTVSSNSFAKAAERLRLATDIAPLDPAAAIGGPDAPSSPCGIRDWMAKHVRIAGPSLYELPLELQLTDPATVLKERYGTRLDYVRTMCALMRGIGCEADVVFSSSDGGWTEELKRSSMYIHPDIRDFSSALCRVREKSGGLLWGLIPFCRDIRTFFVGTENEYTPFGASGYAGSHYVDPGTAGFDIVTLPDVSLIPWTFEERRVEVRVNGAVDFDAAKTIYGLGAGAFRRRYEEMLPEDRSRHHQELIGGISQAASATGELVTDTRSYPARMAYSCYAPAYATVRGDEISIVLPSFSSPLFQLSDTARTAPLDIAPAERHVMRYVVAFPEGYTRPEHLPEPYAFRNPLDFNHVWYDFRVSSRMERGRLVVEIERERAARAQTVLAPEHAGLLRGWSRIGASLANRTITVRKAAK